MEGCKKISLICIWLVFFNSLKSQEVIDVFLIGGQSNAVGIGIINNIPESFRVDTTVLFYHSKYLNGGSGSECWKILSPASVKPEWFGVELSLGTKLKQYFPHKNIALVKHALSGSNLYEQWNPGNKLGEKQGEEYVKWINTVQVSLRLLKEKGYKPIIRAMVWQQGEADARDIAGLSNSRKYGDNLRNFILQVRKDLESPNMLFVYGEVMPLTAERFPGRKLVRKGQIDVSEKSRSSLSVENAILVEGDDLQMISTDYHTTLPHDDVHLGTYGILTLGDRFAKVIFDNLKDW
ncbi:MAG: hypothetical protein KIH02_02490 [Parabacteroides sp.]|nr:hypothetical protein [Parabacteroides sp.]